MPGEEMGLSSRQTQDVVRDREIGQPSNSEKCSETADGVTRESEGAGRLSLLVALISSNQTILVPCGAIFGTVASSSVARVIPMRLPTRSAGVLIATLLGPKMTICNAPFGLQYITVF